MVQFSENEKREIINALITIKSVCQMYDENCYNCPLGDYDNCAVTANIPNDWAIKTTETVWKALE